MIAYIRSVFADQTPAEFAGDVVGIISGVGIIFVGLFFGPELQELIK